MLIYKITNTVNGKIYVGQTVRTLEERKWQHINTAKHGHKIIFIMLCESMVLRISNLKRFVMWAT